MNIEKPLSGNYWYMPMLLIGLASVVALAMIYPPAADAYLPVRNNPPGVPATLGGPPIFDGGYRAWEQTRHQRSWWKRNPNLGPAQLPPNWTVPAPTD